jgi:N-acyl-D-amino-acid deacylase
VTLPDLPDLVIEGGELIDGTGAARRRSDVGVAAGRIIAIGDLSGMSARQRVDARGRIVAPGFIDVHTHDDRLLLMPTVGPHPKLSQGVTTVIVGNCGVSLAPLRTRNPPAPLDILGHDGWHYATFGAYLQALAGSNLAVNVACLVGHSTLRVKHMDNLERPATPSEAEAMAADLAEALVSGAIGLSTGLYYPPAKAANAEEVIAVGASLKAAGGIVTMHIRDEGDAIDEALREALHIGRELGVDTVISHHKLVGTANHGRSVQTLRMLEDAAQKQPVCFDCYPYSASSTMLLPSRVKQSSDVLVTWSQPEPGVAGRSLRELARERGQSEEAVARALQPAGAIYFAMSEDDVSRILSHPMAMVGSDGLAHDVRPHPRLWGTFPRVLSHYVREKKLFSLETAIHKMTGLGARRFGLADRGTLAVGHHADIVIFDPDRVSANASYSSPTEVASGIDAVFVNGRLACRDGQTVCADAGSVLRRSGARSV